MILVKKIFGPYHFVKPLISSLNSNEDLTNYFEANIIEEIKKINKSTFSNQSIHQLFLNKLNVSEKAAKQIADRVVKLNYYCSATHEIFPVEKKLFEMNKHDLKEQDFKFPFVNEGQLKEHFSKSRGVLAIPQLSEYDFNDRIAYVFNLPEDINEKDIKAGFKSHNINTITFSHCALGLPAFAKVQFNSAKALQEILASNPWKKIEFGERLTFIKTKSDQEFMQLKNRQLAIQIDQKDNYLDLLVELSRFGRVLHLDLPYQVYRNPTLHEVKQFYKNSSSLIKINLIHPNGSVQSEYYPRKHQFGQKSFEDRDFPQKAEKLIQNFEHRTRFAKNINIKVGQEHKLSINNRRYCVATFTSPEECQSFYFSHGFKYKMSLVKDQQEFEFDKDYKRELLRQIDNAYLVRDKRSYDNNQNPKLTEKFASKDIYEQLVSQISLTNPLRLTILQNPYQLNKIQQIRKNQNIISKSKSFDELAEIQIFGRKLSKEERIQNLKVDKVNFERSQFSKLAQEQNLILNYKQLVFRNTYYERQRQRNNRIQNEQMGVPNPEKSAYLDSTLISISENDSQITKTNRAQFSTNYKSLYRPRTPQKQANYDLRFSHFIRKTIEEYLGLFRDEEIENSLHQSEVNLLNPQKLQFIGGKQFLTEDDLQNILQFRRNFEEAQNEFQNYWIGKEYILSNNVNLSALQTNYKEIQAQVTQYLTDFGVVAEQYKIKQVQDPKLKLKILNATQAQIGERYHLQKINNQNILIKTLHLQHAYPLDVVEKMNNFATSNLADLTDSQSKIFQKHYQIMQKTGVIPPEVTKQFGIDRQLTFQNLLTEVGSISGIYRKDFEILMLAKEKTKEQIADDIEKQLQIEKNRIQQRKINSDDFAKDPSNIFVKDREGYYRVSRYRQI